MEQQNSQSCSLLLNMVIKLLTNAIQVRNKKYFFIYRIVFMYLLLYLYFNVQIQIIP